MELDWRGRLILRKLEEGCTIREAAVAVGITRQAVLKRRSASADFAQDVAVARVAGRAEPTALLRLRLIHTKAAGHKQPAATSTTAHDRLNAHRTRRNQPQRSFDAAGSKIQRKRGRGDPGAS
jgi:hypothetical protein